MVVRGACYLGVAVDIFGVKLLVRFAACIYVFLLFCLFVCNGGKQNFVSNQRPVAGIRVYLYQSFLKQCYQK